MANIDQIHEGNQHNPTNTGAGVPSSTEQCQTQASSPASSSCSTPSGQAASPILNLSTLNPAGVNTHPTPNLPAFGATQGGQVPLPNEVSLEDLRRAAEALVGQLKTSMRENAQKTQQWQLMLVDPANAHNANNIEQTILQLSNDHIKLEERLKSIERSLLALAPTPVPATPAPMNHASRPFVMWDHQRQINTALDAARDKGEDITWQKIEDTLFDARLTEEEKANALKELITLGRRKGETWRGFAERVRIVARQNRALDNDLMLQPLTRSLPDDIQRHLQVWLKCEQRSIFKTVAEFCNCLQEVPGPTNLQEESSPAALATSSTATYFCQICNINATHSTDGQKECSSCNRVGHSSEDCRSRSRQDSYQSTFRDDRRRRAYSPTRHNDRYRQRDNRREPYRDNRRRNDYRPTNGNSR